MNKEERLMNITKVYQEMTHSNKHIEFIDKDNTFKFECHACGECCRNRVNGEEILVNPYDIYNIAKGLNIGTVITVTKYLTPFFGSNSRLPLLYLNNKYMPYSEEYVCTFLRKGKCSIHQFKPGVCAMFPLGRTQDEEGVIYINQYETHCGCHKGAYTQEHTIKDWIPNIENSEKAFIEWGNVTKSIFEKIDLPKFYDSKLVLDNTKQIFTFIFTYIFYYSYDTSKDFFEQFKDKKQTFDRYLDGLACYVYKFDKTVINPNYKLVDYDYETALKDIIALFPGGVDNFEMYCKDDKVK